MYFYIIKYVYSFQRTHISVRHFVGVFIYAGTINRLPAAADGLPKHCERFAKMLRTDCDNILNKLQQHNIQKTKTILLQCKNLFLALQKPPFCTPKTILLQRKNHTFTWRICNVQITNTLRTLRECISNELRMRGEYVYVGTINRPLRLLTDCKKHTFGFLKHHSYKTQTIVAQNANGIFSYYLKLNNNS